MREEDLYPQVRNWLESELRSSMRGAERINAYITPRTSVTRLLESEGLAPFFNSEYITYDIRVDITGVVVKNGRGHLVFVECKMNKISLRDFSQLLGYSVVARPLYSLIISPKGISDSLQKLIDSFSRTDILKYGRDRRIALAKWDIAKKDIDRMTIIPRGWSFKL